MECPSMECSSMEDTPGGISIGSSGVIHRRLNASSSTVVDPGISERCGETAIIEKVLGIEHDYCDDITESTAAPIKKSGIFAASSNLVNSIVGAGIIGIPYAMRQSGLVAGIFLLALVGWMTDKSLRIIFELAAFHPQLRKLNVHTYEDLAAYPFGRWGAGFVLFNMFVIAYGAIVAYLLIIKDTVPTLLGIGNTWEREIVMIITSLFICVPLAMQRDLAMLSFTSLLSITADIALIIFIAFYAPMKETVSAAGGFGQILSEAWINPTIFIGLGILSDAMACQHSVFIVSGSLANKTKARWGAVTSRSLFIATALSGVMGICGYLGFLGETQGDVLNNFDPDSVVANAARALLAITMFFTYPMESFVARHVLIKLIHDGDMDGGEGAAEADESNRSPGILCLGRRQAWTLGIYLLCLIPAVLVDDLGPVLSITGASGGSCIAYIAPGLMYLGIYGAEFLEMVASRLDNHRRNKSKDSVTGDIELPVAGDATTFLKLPLVPVTIQDFSKPWWWYPLLMPIWCAIASRGSTSMRETLERAESPQTVSTSISYVWSPMDEEDDVVPTPRDFCIAIFFIVFGVVASVTGIISNVFVEVNGTFSSPD